MDIMALARGGVAIGMAQAGNAKTEATMHLGKVDVYDPATDTTTQSAGADVTLLGLFYNDMQAQATSPGFSGRFLVDDADLPEGIDINEADTLTMSGAVWQIFLVDAIFGAAWILHLRK